MAFLYQIRPDGAPIERWEVHLKPLVVGRGDCADAVVDDERLSRSHFLIVEEGAEYFLIDLNSSNGTWIDQVRVFAQKLPAPAAISAGGSVFYFSQTPLPAFMNAPATLVLPALPAVESRLHNN